MMKNLSTRNIIISLLLSLLSLAAMSMSFSGEGGRPEFCGYSIVSPVLLVFCFCFYAYILGRDLKRTRGQKACILIPAILFAVFMLIGSSFEAVETLPHLRGKFDLAKTALYLIGYSVFFYYLTSALFDVFDSLTSRGPAAKRGEPRSGLAGLIDRYRDLLESHTIATVFITILIPMIPYIIISYPGIFLGDEVVQMAQWFEDETSLNLFYPVFHTVLLNVLLTLGIKVFGSANIGIFMYSVVQLVFMIMAVAYLCRYLIKKYHVDSRWIILAEIYYIINPRFVNYLIVTTKDVMYAAALLFFMCFLNEVLDGGRDRRTIAGAVLSGLGVMLFRNEGQYVLIFSFVIILLLRGKKFRKIGAAGALSVIMVSLILSLVIYPVFGIQPGNKREMLSVPFQQTARYLRDAGDSVAEEEKEAISAILDYDGLAKKYDPNRSDDVKKTFKKEATDEELKAYFRAWYSMLRKRPDIYIESFINNYYQYFYPGEVLMNRRGYGFSEDCFTIDNERFGKYGMVLHYPARYNGIRSRYQSLCEAVETLPGMSVLVSAATYSWLLMLMLFYAIYRKCREGFAVLLPAVGILLMCMLGPCNGFFCRYTYPLIIALPAMIALPLCDARKDDTING